MTPDTHTPAALTPPGFSLEELERNERARRALQVCQGLERELLMMAKMFTRRPDIKLRFSFKTISSCTSNEIVIRVPIELGDLPEHDTRNCRKRGEDMILLCDACAMLEDVLITMIHEIAHIAKGTFEMVTPGERSGILRRAIDLECAGKPDGSRAAKLKARIDEYQGQVNDYLSFSNLVSPFLPFLINACEDIRVNEAMQSERPGTRKMFNAQTNRVFNKGIPAYDGSTVWWHEQKPNAQAMIGVYCMTWGLPLDGKLAPEIVDKLESSEPLADIIRRMAAAKSVRQIYLLSFPLLEELRRLGFMLAPDEPEDEPTPEEPQDEEPEDSEPNPEPQLGDSEPDPDGNGEESQDGPSDDSDSPGKTDESDHSDDGEESDGTDPEGDSAPGDDDDSSEDSSGEASEPGDEDDDEDGAGSSGDSDDDASDPSQSDSDTGDQSSEDSDDALDDLDSAAGDGAPGDGEPGGEGDSPEDAEAESSPADADGSSGEDAEGSGQAGDQPGRLDQGDTSLDGQDTGQDDAAHDEPAGDGEPTPDGDDGPQNGDRDTGEPASAGIPEADDPADEPSPPEYTAEDMERDGTPDEVAELFNLFGRHDEHDDDDDSIQQRNQRRLDEAAIERALEQLDKFDLPSVEVKGLNVTKSDTGEKAWRDRGYASTDMPDIPESILVNALTKLRLVFQENKRTKSERHLRHGKVDSRALARRAPFGDDRLFKRSHKPGKRDHFVLIGLDCSGSTAARCEGFQCRFDLMKAAAFAKAEMLHRLGITFAVYAHSGSGEYVEIFEIKKPNDRWGTKEKQALATMQPYAANLDGHTLEFYRKVAAARQETDRFILYYTDGAMPAENYKEELFILQREIDICRQAGIHLVGVGVGTDSPTKHGLDTVRLDGIKDIPQVVSELKKRLAV